MAWALVQTKGSNAASDTFAGAVTAGNLVVAFYSCRDAAGDITVVFSDDQGQSYVGVRKTTNPSLAALGFSMFSAYVPNSVAAALTITATPTGTGTGLNQRIRLIEFSGGATVSPIDKDGGNTGNSATPDSGSVTTTQNGELIVGGMISDAGGAGGGSSYNEIAGTDTVDRYEWKEQSSAGSVSADFTANSGQWIAQILTFKAPSSGVPTVAYYHRHVAGIGA